jgi:ATP-dependent Clp protease ATP-binding subunit ClpX
MREFDKPRWERTRDEADRVREEVNHAYSRRNAWCSFCRRTHSEVEPLAEGPGDVYICYRCARLCADIIEKECQRRGVPLPEVRTER